MYTTQSDLVNKTFIKHFFELLWNFDFEIFEQSQFKSLLYENITHLNNEIKQYIGF